MTNRGLADWGMTGRGQPQSSQPRSQTGNPKEEDTSRISRTYTAADHGCLREPSREPEEGLAEPSPNADLQNHELINGSCHCSFFFFKWFLF